MSFAGTCAICVGALSRRSRQIPVLGVADAVDQVHDAVTGAGDSGAERGTENGTVSAPGQLSQQLDVSTPRHAHPGTCPGQRDVHRSTWLQRVSSGDCPALRLKWATMRGPLTGAVAAPATVLPPTNITMAAAAPAASVPGCLLGGLPFSSDGFAAYAGVSQSMW